MINLPKLKDKRYYYLIPIIVFGLAFFGRGLLYFRGVYIAPDVPTSQAASVVERSQPQQAAPVVGDGNQVVLIDNSHLNKFSDEEMTTLFGRITAAGGRVEVILPLHDKELESRLRAASAFVVLANQEFYELDELIILEKFVRDGGRLLIVGDPTRITFVNAINTIAGHFGIIYEDDYIYNLVENDGNYLNVILRDFAEHPITEGVSEIVVRAAHSIRAAEGGLVFGDENTYSSLRETPGDVTAVVITTNGNVLALPDLTFLTGPYNTFADNDRFIDNIVAFLLNGERQYNLLDFPYFFENTLELVFPDSHFLSENFAVLADLRNSLINAGLQIHQEDNLLPGEQALIIAQYSDLDASLSSMLVNAGVTVNSVGDNINLRDIGELDRSDSVLFQLIKLEDGQYQLFILAADAEALERGVSILLEGKLEECMLRPGTAFCSSDTLATPTPTPTPTRTPFATGAPQNTAEESPSQTPTPTPSE